MSTFDGIIAEFPRIRVDFFRRHPDHQPPLACFLSHVHSDHLAGLESLRSPFVYCSAATREILLRLERYPCRINFAKGILEARIQTFKNLGKLLKPIPLETPTELELSPGNRIRVTLFDANHCPGAVMFLFEGHGKAVLYTGDIRCEPWFVNALARSPSMIPYASGIKTLDKIYLDTSILEDIDFQTKAEGIAELLRNVARYPADTVFFLQAWTYGYEQVWVALSNALGSRIHVDEYKMKIYKALRTKPSTNPAVPSAHLCPEAAALAGYMCGNEERPGCLTRDENVRIHSCEKGTHCSIMASRPVVWICPVVAHMEEGVDRMETGVGGGVDDLEREAELDLASPDDLVKFSQLVRTSGEIPEELRSDILDLLAQMRLSGRNVALKRAQSAFGDDNKTGLQKLFHAISDLARFDRAGTAPVMTNPAYEDKPLPNMVTFPYARHSSLPELRHLVQTLSPRDVWPCTVHPDEWQRRNLRISSLFGDCCSGDVFEHDAWMDEWSAARSNHQRSADDSQRGQETQGSSRADEHVPPPSSPPLPPRCPSLDDQPLENTDRFDHIDGLGLPPQTRSLDGDAPSKPDSGQHGSQQTVVSVASVVTVPSDDMSLERLDARDAMLRNLAGEDWTAISLLSTTGHHAEVDRDHGHYIKKRPDTSQESNKAKRHRTS